MNKTIYIVTAVISILLMIPACIWQDDGILTALSGIGCSGIAAAIMAFFLDWSAETRDAKRLLNAKSNCFEKLNLQLVMMIERILWFDERIDEADFNWNLDATQYCTMQYYLYAASQYKEKELSFGEADERISKLREKYNSDSFARMGETDRQHVQKMFNILAISGSYLIDEATALKNDKLLLTDKDYISFGDIETILFNISLGIGLMQQPDKNYGVAISSLQNAMRQVRTIGRYTDKVRIGLHGSIQINEL